MGFYRGPKLVTDGLVLALDAGSFRSYPGTGNTWFDLSGNSNNGTLTNGPTFNTNNKGNFSFDGVDDICRFSSSTFTSGSPQQGTFILIIKIPPVNTNSGVIFNDGGSTSNLIYFYRNSPWNANQYSWLIYYTSTTGTVPIVPLYTYTPDTWVHTAMTFSLTGTYKLYVNGDLKNTTNASNFLSWNRTGTAQPSLNPSATGSIGTISSFYYYNRELQNNEVNEHYNVTKSRFGI